MFPFAERPNSAGVYRYKARSKFFFPAGIMVKVKMHHCRTATVRESVAHVVSR
jgi:hypothetical protein